MNFPNPADFSADQHYAHISDAPHRSAPDTAERIEHTGNLDGVEELTRSRDEDMPVPMTDYDHGWLDGFTAGVLDGRTDEDDTRKTSSDISPSNPGDLDDTTEPGSSDANPVSVQITTRTVRGRRGPWGMIHPTG